MRFVSNLIVVVATNVLVSASKSSCRKLSTMCASLASIADVDIDPKGVFKYILIKATDKESKSEKLIVRGYKHCHFHGDIFEETENALGTAFKLKCLGGGRIKHEPESSEILVYGYSQGYGPADHQKTVDILKTKYPSYKITFSNEGY
ncbi:unnamed protein product [Anisakis simplex]|uniref:Sex-regulated protein janus-B n=1 Tax=Anisakis simplex TaxID=6269 RepID=A0A0M3KB29_ANISI|nr:unnamed protein product [Anisakis simplex]